MCGCEESRQPPGRRADYRWFHLITTRWMDNDVFRHVNNVNYFSFFDTAVTYFEMTSGVVELLDGPVHCVVAEVMCRYHSSAAFPDRIIVGIRVARIGRSSVRYEIGVFRNGMWFLDITGNHQLVQSDIVGWGQPSDTPVVGDWNNTGTAKIGVFSSGTWFLDLNGNHQLTSPGIISWGKAGDKAEPARW